MKKHLLTGILLALWVNMICTSAVAGSVEQDTLTCTLYPTEDAFISQKYFNSNYGTEEKIQIRERYGGSSSSNWANSILIKFDLSSMPSEVYIADAELYLYYYSYEDNDPKDRELTLYRLSEDWDETTVTYESRPRNAGWNTSVVTVPSDFGLMSWDVTCDVQDFIDGPWENHGWQILDETAWGTINIPTALFYSKEKGTKKPYLKITYSNERPNTPPMADSNGPYHGYVNESVIFDASGSTDSDGTIAGYQWDFDNDTVWDTEWLSTATTTYTYNSTGNYTAVLQVKDNENATATNTTMVYITIPANQPPEANFTYTPLYPIIPDDITFYDNTIDTDGSIVSWWWDFGDGHFSNLQNTTHQYIAEDVYTVTLTVTDDDDANNTIQKEVQIRLYRCGDLDDDGEINTSDAAYLIRFLYINGDAPDPYCRGDVTHDGVIDITDITALIRYIYASEYDAISPGGCD
jgi:PKD repeat protein